MNTYFCNTCKKVFKSAAPVCTHCGSSDIAMYANPKKSVSPWIFIAILSLCGLCSVLSLTSYNKSVRTVPSPTEMTVKRVMPTIIPTKSLPNIEPLPTVSDVRDMSSVDYANWLKSQMDDIISYRDYMLELSSLFSDMSNDPVLMLDSFWVDEVKLALRGMKDVAKRMAANDSPNGAAPELDRIFDRIYYESREEESDIVKGLDNMDVNALNAALVHIGNITNLFEDATSVVQEYK